MTTEAIQIVGLGGAGIPLDVEAVGDLAGRSAAALASLLDDLAAAANIAAVNAAATAAIALLP